MVRVAACVALLAAGCAPLPSEAAEPAVRAHIVESIGSEKNWYADWFGLKTGADVVAKARRGTGKTVYIDVTTAASATCFLSMILDENEHGDPRVEVLGIWAQRGDNQRGSQITSLVGDVYLEKRADDTSPIQLRFSLSVAGRTKDRVALMGGITVVPEGAR